MALGVLQILFYTLVFLAIAGLYLLYMNNEKFVSNNFIFIYNVLLSILFSFFIFTSLPSNYISEKIIALLWGFIAIIAYLLKSNKRFSAKTGKILLTISLLGGLVHLFI